MREVQLPDAESVAHRAAAEIASAARDAVSLRDRFLFATSGGTTPWRMLRILATLPFPWAQSFLFQVDERVAPDGNSLRNATHLADALLMQTPEPLGGVFLMPLGALAPEVAAERYASTLHDVCGAVPILDLVHLGLGDDGHTASLVPNDPVLDVVDRDVAATLLYAGTRRVTLTYPIVNRARRILWVVTGPSKRDALARLRAADPVTPAGRVQQARALLLTDDATI